MEVAPGSSRSLGEEPQSSRRSIGSGKGVKEEGPSKDLHLLEDAKARIHAYIYLSGLMDVSVLSSGPCLQ